MYLYFTDAIGFSKAGKAIVKAHSTTDAIQKIAEFIDNYPHYQLFKTKIITGVESDEIDFDIMLTLIEGATVSDDSNCDINILDSGGLNEDPAIGNGLYIS